MSAYTAPLADMEFALREIAGMEDLAELPKFAHAESDLTHQILEEAGKFAAQVLNPLDQGGDEVGAQIENGVVRTPPGFADAYRQFGEAGWISLQFEEENGGQSLPSVLQVATGEMWNAANMSFALCPLLNQGASDVLERRGTPEQQEIYLKRMIAGEWTGTMNLTEPQAGTDLGSIRTKSERQGDHYLIKGQKIYITYGEHDMSENIIHLVLARSPDGPPGPKGLSLYLVPKFLVNPDGSLGRRNDLRAVSLESKIGIHGSPTCVMSYGDNEGAVGYLIGEENKGLENMFIMMNNARLMVGLQGVSIADRAYQQAAQYAKDRVQSRAVEGSAGPVAIIQHPDVRRMLMDMRAHVEAMRALTYLTAAELDRGAADPDPERAAAAQAMAELLIPVVKAYNTDRGVEIASTNVQIHGGMGFIEDTRAGQLYRDSRILPIYEGANGIHALDLVGRKVARDGGAAAARLIAQARAEVDALTGDSDARLGRIADRLATALDSLEACTDWVVTTMRDDPRRGASGSSPYLKLMGVTVGGWLLAKGAGIARRALDAGEGDGAFLDDKITTAEFFAQHHLSQVPALAIQVTEGGDTVLALDEARF